jgi:hypothetical protein
MTESLETGGMAHVPQKRTERAGRVSEIEDEAGIGASPATVAAVLTEPVGMQTLLGTVRAAWRSPAE